jgi:hypothetical protein
VVKHLSEALARCWRNKVLLLALCVLIWTPTEVLADQVWGLFEHERLAVVMSSFVYAAGTAASSAGFMHVFAREAAQRPSELGDALQIGARRAPAVFLTGLLIGIFVTLGLVLLVVPALVAAVWFSLTTAVIVVEGSSGWVAMRRSRELVRGRAWPIFGVVLALWVVPMAVESLIAVGGALAEVPVALVDLGTGWLVVLLQTPVHAALFGFYLEARFDDPTD